MDTELDPELTAVAIPNTDLVCDCEHCRKGRLVHWYCDGCGGGPYRFAWSDPAGAPCKTPYGQRQYNDVNSGLVAGIRRWCSAACAINEEKVYLMDQLDRAQARRDLTTIRVINGRLHELANGAPQIPNRTEKLTRVESRAKSLVATPDLDLSVAGDGDEGDAA